MEKDTFGQIRSVVMDHLGVERSQVTPATSFIDDLEVGSLDAMELILAVEGSFNIGIPDKVVATLITVQDVVDYVEQQKTHQCPETPPS
jgi:acyl carrier protein